jgi:hypothetical protein
MKKLTLIGLLWSLSFNIHAQVVEIYGEGNVSEKPAYGQVDIEEVGRLITVASIEESNLVVRHYYRGKWSQIGTTILTGLNKVEKIDLFNYKNVPYVFCFYDGKMSVIRSINDQWEIVGEKTFGEGNINNPQFSVIGAKPFIVYEDEDYEMIRMISLLDDSWYDVDLISTENISSYKLAANLRGDLFLALIKEGSLEVKKVIQTSAITEWENLTKPHELEGITALDQFQFVDNNAFVNYRTPQGMPVIISLLDGEKKWETKEELTTSKDFGNKDMNLNISEYYFFTATNPKTGIPQFLKNNKKGNWGKVTNLSDKKAKCVASCDYNNIIYVAYVDFGSSNLIVKKIEKGLNDDEEMETSEKDKKKK